MNVRRVRLDLGALSHSTEQLTTDLSSVQMDGDYLWLVHDETLSVQRLTKSQSDPLLFGQACSFSLLELLELDSASTEADLEGVDINGDFLWVVGSHAHKRKKARAEDEQDKSLKRLEKIVFEANRYLLACLPFGEDRSLVQSSEAGEAAYLPFSQQGNVLSKMLLKDKHLGWSVSLASKENGLDIEGLVAFTYVDRTRLILGLRGPIVGGYTILLIVEPTYRKKRQLKLASLDGGTRKYLKIFLPISSLGIRDLYRDGEYLLILAGPTLDMSGPFRLYRWRIPNLLDQDIVVPSSDIEQLFELPSQKDCDRPEGVTRYTDRSDLLILHDSPCKQRLLDDGWTLCADLFEYPKI